MGAGQSSEIEESAEMETLYDILGVEKNATDSELKKAYKKQALLLHPDRNYENPEEATKKFARIQAAFDVLSDPQERAWYDSHGSESGRTGADDPEYGGGRVTSSEELKKYFDPIYYQNISERKEEFYDLVSQLFDQLAKEEGEAALDLDLEEPLLPFFGSDSSPWRDVKSFYDSWTSFSSVKTFAWEDIYRAWDAPDRRSRRAMEVRNKKIRDAAKKEFNETVRALASSIKQKDPRVRAQTKKSKSKPEDLTSASKEQARRARSEQAAKRQTYEEQDWAKPEAEIGHDLESDEEDSSEDVVNLFECIVCDKMFKTKKQLSVHEDSKKHIKNLRDLKREMRKEGVELGFDDNQSEDEGEVEEEDEEGIEGNTEGKSGDYGQNPTRANSDNKFHMESSDDESNTISNASREKLNGKVTGSLHTSDSESESDHERKSNQKNSSQDPTLEELLAQLEGTRVNKTDRADLPTKKSGKAKQKRTKKEVNTSNNFANKCGVCQTEFSSRNKLFEHVKVSGHAVPVKGGKGTKK
jgi:DnaJ family protein A protein 5